MPSAAASAGTASACPPRARAAAQRTSASALLSLSMCAAGLPASVSGTDVAAPRLMNGIGPYLFDDGAGNLVNRQHNLGPAAFYELTRHSPNDGGRFGFGNGAASAPMQFGHRIRAVAAHSGHQHSEQCLRL